MRAFLVAIKKLSIATFVLVMLGYVGNLLIDNPYVHSFLRNEINRNLDRYTYLNVKFEAISVKFLPLGLDIYGIEIKQDAPTEIPPLLQAMHLQLRVSLAALLLSKRELLELEVTGPKLSWPIPPLEKLLRMEKFPELLEKHDAPVWPPHIALPFHQVAFTNASLQFTLPPLKEGEPDLLKARIEGMDLVLSYRNAEYFDVASEIQRLNLDVEGKPLIQETKLKTILHQRKTQLTSELFQLQSSEVKVNSQLNITYETAKQVLSKRSLLVKNPEQHLIGFKVDLKNQVDTADIAILGRYLKADKSVGPLQGQADLFLDLPLDDRPTRWNITGHGKSRGATLSGFKLLDSKLDFRINEHGMNFIGVRAMKGDKLLAKGEGFLGFTPTVPFSYTIIPEKLGLAELLDILQVDDFKAVDAALHSESISLKGQAVPFQIKVDGGIEFENITLPEVMAKLPQRYLDGPSCKMQTQLAIDESAVRIETAKGLCRAAGDSVLSPLQLSGKFGYSIAEGLDFSLEMAEAQAALLNHFAKFPSSGLLNATLRLQGPYDQIVMGGDVKASQFNVSGFQGKELSARFRFPFSADEVFISEFDASDQYSGSVRLKNSSVGITAPFKFQTEVDVQGLSAEFLHQGLKQTFDVPDLLIGIRALQGRIGGELLKPFAYRGKLHFVAQNLQFDQQTFFHEATGSILADDTSWALQGAYARLDQIELRLDADVQHRASKRPPSLLVHQLGIAPDDRVHLHLKTINKNLNQYRTNDVTTGPNHLASLPYIGPYFKAQNFGGLIQLESDLEGPIDKLQGKIEGALEQPFIWGIPISSFYISGFVDGMALHIPEFRHSGNSLVGRLNIDFGKKDLPYDWYFYLNQMDIRAFLTKTFADDPRNFAYLSAEWTMKGRLGDFWGSSGELTLSRVRSKFFRNLGSRTSSIELNSDQAIRVQISPDSWRLLDKRPLKLQGEFFDLELSAGENRLPNSIDLSLQGSIKLDILKNFTHLAETARGEILIEGYLRGPITKPDLSIRFRERKLDPFNMKEWTPVSLGMVDYGPPLTALSLDVEVKSDRVIVHKIHANKGREGAIDVRGVLSFSEQNKEVTRLLVKLDRIEMNRLSIPALKTADLVMSGDLSLSGNSFPLLLTGNVRIDRFYSLGNFDLRREIVASLYETKLNASLRNGADGQNGPYLDLDVGIVADKSIVLKNKSIEAVLSANLRVRGTEAKPLLLGQIIADRGSFSYRRLFKINQAVISFDEPVSPPNPRLDIIGETTVNPYQVQVMVNGDLSNPKVTLTCDPPNREDGSPISNLDIVLLISTGKIPEQANKTAEKASVNEIFSSFLVFAEEPIEKLFDLSGQTVIREVYIDSYLSEAEQRPITRLNVPFNLWGMANAVVQVDDESNTKLSFEYPIHEGITLSGSLDSKKNKEDSQENVIPKDTGFDLKFRFGFD